MPNTVKTCFVGSSWFDKGWLSDVLPEFWTSEIFPKFLMKFWFKCTVQSCCFSWVFLRVKLYLFPMESFFFCLFVYQPQTWHLCWPCVYPQVQPWENERDFKIYECTLPLTSSLCSWGHPPCTATVIVSLFLILVNCKLSLLPGPCINTLVDNKGKTYRIQNSLWAPSLQ